MTLRWVTITSAAACLLNQAACSTPCDRLKSRTDDCRTTPGRYVDDRRSICTATRDELTPAEFDPFADCVAEAACDDTAAVRRCQDEQIDTEITSCLQLKLWASACRLEPVGTDDDCETLNGSMGEFTFESWVDCITADGCPVPDDPRYDVCQQEILGPGAANLIDACVIVTAWTEECASQPLDIPVSEMSFPECIAEAELFSSESYLNYGLCLQTVECNNFGLRLDCIFRLRLLDPSHQVVACERLITFAATCGSDIGGGSIDACSRLFARFTPESFDAYVTCIEAGPCDDPAASAQCFPLLDVQ